MVSPLAPPRKAQRLELSRNMTIHEAFTATVANCLGQLEANRPGVIRGAEDTEYIHQARVSLRRLRSGLKLFAPVVGDPPLLAEDLRWLGQRLGGARDWDVFVTTTLASQRESLAPLSGWDELCRQAEAIRDDRRKSARSGLRGERHRRALRELEAWRTAPGKYTPENVEEAAGLKRVGKFASHSLDRHYRKLTRGDRHPAALAPGERHQLRIAAKKMRYAAEFFATLFPGPEDFIRRLEGLQDVLGELNDRDVTRALIGELDDNPARVALLAWNEEEEATLMAGLDKAWKKFLKAAPFWRKH